MLLWEKEASRLLTYAGPKRTGASGSLPVSDTRGNQRQALRKKFENMGVSQKRVNTGPHFLPVPEQI